MNKENQNIVPVLRFPEFINSKGWELDKFSSFIKLYRGSSPRPINQFLTKDKNGVNWIKIGDTKNATNFKISEVEEKITTDGSKKSRKVVKGELILANSMSYGATYKLDIDGCIYDGWFVLREYEDSFYKQFLLQLLNSNFLQTQYKRLAAGGIVQNISSEIVYNTLLPIVLKKEQQKIASCLSFLDDLIGAETEKLDALQDHKKGLLQQLFPAEGETIPQLRFPEFENDGEWEEMELGVAIDGISSQIAKNKLQLLETGYAIYGADGFIGFIDSYAQEKDYIAIVKDGSGVGNLFYYEGHTSLLGTLNYLVTKDETKFRLKWVYYLLQTISFKPFVKGSGIPHIYYKDYAQLLVLIPSPEEQESIAGFLTSLDNFIVAQTDKIESLKDHKKGLMQQLFPTINESTL